MMGGRRTARQTVLGVIAGVSVPLGCADASPVGERETRTTIGDTAVVRTLSGSAWNGRARLVEDLRIGTLDGEEAYLFGDVTALAPDGRGGVYVFDRQLPLIRRYGADGVHRFDVGRGGEGPGEYGSLSLGMAVARDGVLLVNDWGGGRIVRFDGTGSALDPWPIDAGYLTTVPGAWFQIGPEGQVFQRQPVDGRDAYLRIEEGEIVDTLLAPIVPGTPDLRGGPYRTEQITGFDSRGHFVVARNDLYDVLVAAPNALRRVMRDVEPLTVDREEAAEWRARFEWMQSQPSYTPPEGEWIPSRMPPLRELRTSENRLWVRRNTTPIRTIPSEAPPSASVPPPVTFEQPHLYDVFASDGAYLGEIRFPDGALPLHFSDEVVWGIRRGDLDEIYVIRWRVESD